MLQRGEFEIFAIDVSTRSRPCGLLPIDLFVTDIANVIEPSSSNVTPGVFNG
jgi:hypothetical protein